MGNGFKVLWKSSRSISITILKFLKKSAMRVGLFFNFKQVNKNYKYM